MSSGKRDFASYSTPLPDGGRLVEVIVSEPRRAYVFVEAASKREAFDLVTRLGATELHVVTRVRPWGDPVRAFLSGDGSGVFHREYEHNMAGQREKFWPLTDLNSYLSSELRADWQ